MEASVQKSRILFISSFPPNKTGTASFTKYLVNAIKLEMKGKTGIGICALDTQDNAASYKYPVSMVMDGHLLDSCLDTAEMINKDPSVKLLCMEHQFGLYGGELDEFMLGFLSMVDKPFIIRFHTVPPHPGSKLLKMFQSFGLLADKVIVMTKHAGRLLRETYELSPDKIIILPHGTPAGSLTDAADLKLKYKLENKQVLTTSGLLTPAKGIEKGILAMKEISARFPNAVYLVLGQTHPGLLVQEGEKYRNYLQELITYNNLEENVRLINEYLPAQKLMEYLALTDIYLFTSKNPELTVSGTLVCAMSAGCPVISGSSPLAKEMLDEKTGVILTTDKPGELAKNAIRILRNPGLQKEMSEQAFLKMRNTTWEKIAQKHVSLFHDILGTSVYAPELADQFIS